MPAPADKRVLTELLLRRLRPRAHRFLIWDRKQSGLALQIRPNGRRGWKCIYSCRGRVRWFHLGDGNAIGLQQARELARDIMYAVAKGEDPQAEKRARRNAGTFAELAERYVEDYAKRRNKSWRQGDKLSAAELGEARGQEHYPFRGAARDWAHCRAGVSQSSARGGQCDLLLGSEAGGDRG